MSARFVRALCACSMLALSLAIDLPAGAEEFDEMSLEELMDVEVTSVSKRKESVLDAAAALTVITSEEIRRSGANSIPDLLRAVPGLHVAQVSSSSWQITSRGFNDQFANKLLVMIDGRSVYTPLFSGTFWDVQDLVLEDVERIEVVRGPGGAVWGANAVNGVINIITKSAAETQGLLVSALGGNKDHAIVSGRYGHALGDNAHFRASLKYSDRDHFGAADGVAGIDAWDQIRGGFRLDLEPTPSDLVTLQGDYYDGDVSGALPGATPTPSATKVSGGNVLVRWTRAFAGGSEMRFQGYYDRTERKAITLDEDRDTFDLSFEHQAELFSVHEIVWGLGYRFLHDQNLSLAGVPVAFFPAERSDHLVSGFVQDRIELFDDALQLTMGTKLEYNDYTGFEVQPSVRALVRASERQRVWAAVSRAVRTPSRADDDVAILMPAQPPANLATISGDRGFDSEELISFEAGYRLQPIDELVLEAAGYYNRYDDLRSSAIGAPIVTFPGPVVTLPISIGNDIEATAWGAELSLRARPWPWWQLTANYTYMQVDVHETDGVTFPLVDPAENSTPDHQVQLLSRIDLPCDVAVDASLFWVDQILGGAVGDYVRLDLRLGWKPIESLELSFGAQNVTKHRHLEVAPGALTQRTAVPRSFYGKATWEF